LDPQPQKSYMKLLREQFAPGALASEPFADAQADKLPRDILRAALNEEISPALLLRLRFELVQGAVDAVTCFGLKLKLLEGLPFIHPDWDEGTSLGLDELDTSSHHEPTGMQCREEDREKDANLAVGGGGMGAGGLGGGSPGSKEIFRLQQALMLIEARHADTQEVMAVETRVAREVLKRSMQVAPTLSLDPAADLSPPAHVPVQAQRYPGVAQGVGGYGDDGADSVVSWGSRRSRRSGRSQGSERSTAASAFSFVGGFDLSAALESTQHALFGAPAPSASAVAGKAAKPVPGARLPRALVAQPLRQPAGPAHEPVNVDEAGRRDSSAQGVNCHGGSTRRSSEGLGSEGDGDDGGEEGGDDRDLLADAEPDNFWSGDDDAASHAGSSLSHWSASQRKRGRLGEAAIMRQSLSRPRCVLVCVCVCVCACVCVCVCVCVSVCAYVLA
jgi:hypothetical protein